MNASPLSDKPRLFVDFTEVEQQENVTRICHQAVKHGHPVIRQEAPWERHAGMTASIILDEDEGVFKAWYMAGFYAPGKNHVQRLALSHDGIRWERPNLGLHEALGSTENTIVIPAEYHGGQDHFETMLKDPSDPDPSRRYKAIGWSSYDWDGPLSGIYTATSPDGLNWAHTPQPVFRFHPRPGTNDLGPVGDAQSLMIDTLKRRYVAFLRSGLDRMMSVSDDFVHWTPPELFLAALHGEEGLYNNTGFVYGEQYLGLLTHFNKHPLAMTQTLRLLISRDGNTWHRIPGDDLIPLGDVGEWDRFQILLTGAPPIRVDDKLYIYYRGTPRRHAKIAREFDPRIAKDQQLNTMSIGLATLRLDGFASICASFDGGVLTTTPVRLGGNHLSLNLKSDYGSVRVELLDENNHPFPGYTVDDCLPVRADSVDARVRWKNRTSLGELKKRPVKLKIHLFNARLYSYRCV